jgi:hypothetical protein
VANGLDWLVRQLERCPDAESISQQAGLLLAVVTRPNEALVTILGSLHTNVQGAFWRRVNTIFVAPGFPATFRAEAHGAPASLGRDRPVHDNAQRHRRRRGT